VDVPLRWSNEQNVLWRTAIGSGNSSPVLAAGKVFVTTEPDELVCLDQASGEVLWRRTNGLQDLPAELRDRALELYTECGYASPTPCADTQRVYVLFGTGVVACYDFQGQREWIRLIEAEPIGLHGRSASPVLVGDRLLVHVSDLFCLDAQTGKTRWRQPAVPAFGTSLPIEIGSTPVVVTPMGDVFRIGDGKKMAEGIAGMEVPSPVEHEGVVYFIASKAKALSAPQGVADAEEAGTLKFIALWEAKLEGQFYASPLVHAGTVYTVSREGRLFALDARSGETVASRKLEAASEFAPSLSLTAGKLSVQSDSGVTFIVEPGRELRLLQKNELLDGSVATPAFSRGRIFIRGEDKLWCIGAAQDVARAPAKVGVSSEGAGRRPRPPANRASVGSPTHLRSGRSFHTTGWRGNGNGRFPDSSPPLKWRKISRLMSGFRCSAARPERGRAQGSPAYWGAITEWLLLGPLPAQQGQGVKQTPLDETTTQPDVGERIDGSSWRPHSTNANLLDFLEIYGKDARGVVYAHTYLWSEIAGRVRLRFNHHHAPEVWLNGSALETETKRIKAALKKGWNRLLCKVVWRPQKGKFNVYPSLWHLGVSIEAVPPYETETKNILWQARLPSWSVSGPLICGDRIYVMSEPNALVCLDKGTGKILWIRPTGYYETLSDQDRAKPPYAELAVMAKRQEEINRSIVSGDWPGAKRMRERARIHKELNAAFVKIDRDKYSRKWNEMHGFTVPTPVSDGSDVYVWISYGIGARYDRDGNRKWVHLETEMIKHHGYTSSPVLVDGKMIVYMKKLIAIDTETGKVTWRAEAAKDNRLYGDHFHETPAIIQHEGNDLVYVHGMIVRPSDGEVLWEDPKWKEKASIPSAVVADDTIFHFTSGGRLRKSRLPAAQGRSSLRDEGTLRIFSRGANAYTRTFLAASPLYHEGLLYTIDCMGNLRVIDAGTQKLVYEQDLALGLEIRTNVHCFGTAYASPILAGDAIVALGMTGTMVAFKPGRRYLELARNKIEHLTNPGMYYQKPEGFPASPVCEGDRLYIRGDGHLYCIGVQNVE